MNMYRTITDALLERPAESWLLPGLSTGFAPLDRALGGILPGDLILVAARQGNYGQIFTENLAAGLARKCPVLYLATDRKAHVVASELQSVLLPATEEEQHDDELLDRLNRNARNLYIDEAVFQDEIAHSVEEFRAAFPGDAAVVVDTLNGLLLTNDPVTFPREAEESRIADNLKRLALKFQVPVILYKRLGPESNTDLMHLAVWGERFERVVGVSRPGNYRNVTESAEIATENLLSVEILKPGPDILNPIMFNIHPENRFRISTIR